MVGHARYGLLASIMLLLPLCLPEKAAGGVDSGGDPAGRLWPGIRILSPLPGTRVLSDESVLIWYDATEMPDGWKARLLINENVAYENAETPVRVSVPGLVVGSHRVEVILIDHRGGESGVHDVSIFTVVKGFTWVRDSIRAHGQGTSSCEAGRECTFDIDVADDGSGAASLEGNFFRVRLVGPAIVMGDVRELGRGRYRARFVPHDAGAYDMNVTLLFARHSGPADPGSGVPREFHGQQIGGSPFRVTVNASRAGAGAAGGRAPRLCRGHTARMEDPAAREGVAGEGGGRWVHRDACAWGGGRCGGVDAGRFEPRAGAGAGAGDPWVWVPGDCELRPYTREEVVACFGPGGAAARGAPPGADAALLISGTSLLRTMYYDVVCLLDPACNATKEHEDLVHPGPPRVAFHWVARFADHTEFERPPLGHLDRVTGRLRFNHTLADLLAAIAREAPRPQDVVVLGSQIFDILKAPLSDYEENMKLLIAALQDVNATVLWRTGDALHDATLDAAWDFATRPGRYMNDPRMQRANAIAVQRFRQAGYGVLDAHAVTHGREDRSHDGTHYWNEEVFKASGSALRVGNGISQTNAQTILNRICNPRAPR